MARPKITVEFDDHGMPIVEVHNVKGKGCEAITADLERALGTVSNRTLKREHRLKGEEGRKASQ